jgi:hypothetical protein
MYYMYYFLLVTKSKHPEEESTGLSPLLISGAHPALIPEQIFKNSRQTPARIRRMGSNLRAQLTVLLRKPNTPLGTAFLGTGHSADKSINTNVTCDHYRKMPEYNYARTFSRKSH